MVPDWFLNSTASPLVHVSVMLRSFEPGCFSLWGEALCSAQKEVHVCGKESIKKSRFQDLHLKMTMLSHRLKKVSTIWINFFFQSNSRLRFSLHTTFLPASNFLGCFIWQFCSQYCAMCCYILCYMLHPSLEGDCVSVMGEVIPLSRIICNQLFCFRNER